MQGPHYPPPKMMTAKEFRALGLLQEVNRQFLHPLGLALEIVIEDDGSERFGEVWDSRDDPEGYLFADAPDPTKAEEATRLYVEKSDVRKQKLGWVVQPVGVAGINTKKDVR